MGKGLLRVLFLENTVLKIVALVFAIALWFLVVGEKRTEVGFLIPLEFKNLPGDMIIAGEPLREVEVRVLGSKKILANLSPVQLTADLDLSTAKEGINNFIISLRDVKVPKGVEVIKINPASLLIHIEPRIISKAIRVKVKLTGSPARGISIKGISVKPDTVKIFGVQTRLKDMEEIYTVPMDINGIRNDKTAAIAIHLNGTGLKRVEPDTVKVKVTVGKAASRQR